MSNDAPGMVGVIAQETGRYTAFAESITRTELPPGSEIVWRIGMNIAGNCNALARALLATNGEWLWLLGDDHAWSPDLLIKLLAHGEDIVVPLCLGRLPPYRPVAFLSENEKGRERLDLQKHRPVGGLMKIHSAGSGGMLIRRSVFEKIPEPWFEIGKIHSEKLSEDLYFCDKARAAELDIHLDFDASLGHCFAGAVWPVREHDGWTFAFSMGGFQVTMPPGMQAHVDRIAKGASA